MELLQHPLPDAEFLVVDTETNGRQGDACELTEVGAVLVGGRELHEEFGSLVAVGRPLGRAVQRLTGISQAMVHDAPEPAGVLAELARRLEGRVLVAHNASFDRRVLRAAFGRAELHWPDPPILCTVALARRFAPLAQRRGLAPLAATLGIDVDVSHRALPDARTCARVLCALLPRLCAYAPTVGDAVALLGARRRRSAPRTQRPVDGPPASLQLGALPDEPGVYLFRDGTGRVLYVGKSVGIRARARSHFTGADGEVSTWTRQAEMVEARPTHSELGALVLENRLIKALRPPGNVALKSTDRLVYLRCRLDIAFPILEVAAEPAAGHAVSVGPLRGRHAAVELVEQLNSLFGLRRCGRGLPRRAHPSAYGQMGRCLSPCLGDLDPNLYRRRLDEALAIFAGRDDGRRALVARVRHQMRVAAEERAYERAAWLRRRLERLEVLLGRLGGVLRATHARSRLVLAPHPRDSRFDAFWLLGGRVADWGPLPADPSELHRRTRAALARAGGGPGGLAGHVPPDEVDELRIVSGWLAAHEDLPALELAHPGPDLAALTAFCAAAARPASEGGDDREGP